MTLHGYEKELDYFIHLIEKKIKHSYLDQYIDKTMIEEEKIIALDALLFDFSASQKENYIVTISLIEMALNLHDTVTEGPELPENTPERVTKQLTVLAGDYYSALYYVLLSKVEDYQMIHTLAAAIKEINEFKMKLHYQEYSSLDEFVSLIGKINSLLITHLAEHIGEYSLAPFISDWLLLNKLILKQDNESAHLSFLTIWLQDMSLYSNEMNNEFLDKKIMSLAASLQKAIKKVPDRYIKLKKAVSSDLDKIKMPNDTTISITEEG